MELLILLLMYMYNPTAKLPHNKFILSYLIVIKLNVHIKPIHFYFVVAGFETRCFRIILEHCPTTYEICLIWPLSQNHQRNINVVNSAIIISVY